MPPKFPALRESFRQGAYNITTHGYEEMESDGITVAVLETAIGGDAPEVIEDYPQDDRAASCLVLGWTGPSEPIHTVIAYWSEAPILITAYRPNLVVWEEDYRTRKETNQ